MKVTVALHDGAFIEIMDAASSEVEDMRGIPVFVVRDSKENPLLIVPYLNIRYVMLDRAEDID